LRQKLLKNYRTDLINFAVITPNLIAIINGMLYHCMTLHDWLTVQCLLHLCTYVLFMFYLQTICNVLENISVSLFNVSVSDSKSSVSVSVSKILGKSRSWSRLCLHLHSLVDMPALVDNGLLTVNKLPPTGL